MKIESLNNPKVKEWSKLKVKKYRDLTNEFLIEGDHLLECAFKSNLLKEIIALDSTYEVPNIPFYEVTPTVMKKLSSQVTFPSVIGICKKINKKNIEGNVVILDNIQDPGNLGAIIRSAVAFNIKTVILSNDTVDLYNEKTIRASEGMLFNLSYKRGIIKDEIDYLRANGYTIYGTDVLTGNNLKDISFKDKSAIIIGNEGKGMDTCLIPLCDYLINIPLNNNCESLNASIAASIIFYELNQK